MRSMLLASIVSVGCRAPVATTPRSADTDFQRADALDARARAGDRAARDQELAIYRGILENPHWHAYARRDEVLFWYAHALATAGRAGDARAVLDELVAGYPRSKLRDDALITLGDARFDAADLAGALASYEAARFPADDDRGWYARYRIAWCHFDLGDHARAADELAAVAAAPRTGKPARAKLIAQAEHELATWRADPTYARAEQLYAAGDFCGAAPLYARATGDEAAYAHVLATLSCEHLLDRLPDTVAGDVAAPIPPPWQRAIAAMDLYLERVAHGPERPTVQFQRARILYAFAHLPDAAGGFREVIRTSTDDELSRNAALLLLDSDARGRGDLAGDVRAVCALPVAKTAELAKVCRR